MVDDLAQIRYLTVQFQLAGGDKPVDELAVMDDLQVKPILPVIVFQGGEAMGALGDNLGDSLVVKEMDIFSGHLVKDVFIPQSPQAVAAAFLFFAKNPPGDAGRVQDGGQGHGGVLLAGVEGTGAAHIEEVLSLAGDERLDRQGTVPLGPLAGSDPPRITTLLHV